jgi:hypothetical protein
LSNFILTIFLKDIIQECYQYLFNSSFAMNSMIQTEVWDAQFRYAPARWNEASSPLDNIYNQSD